MLLCDAAEASEGKLFILGGGWTITGPGPSPSAVALLIEVPWDQANHRNKLVLELLNEDGQPVIQPGQILHGVLTQRGATAVGVGEPGRPAAAKTGTAEEYSASDFAGYVPQMAAAVWVGNPHRPNSSLAYSTIGGRHYGQVFGATIGGPIWRDTMRAALVGVPVEPLPKADRSFIFGKSTSVPDVAGLTAYDARKVLEQAGFGVAQSTKYVESLLPAGTVAYTTPGAGSSAPQGSTIVLHISNGIPPPPPTPKPKPTPTPSSTPSTQPSPSPSSTPTRKHHGPH